MWHLLVWLLFLFFFLFVFSCPSFCCFVILFNAHLEYLQWERTSSICINSFFSSSELEHTDLALCVRVLITLNLQARLWWPSHWRYKSVCVDFLYTHVIKVPSSFGVTNVCKMAWNHLPSVLLWWTWWKGPQNLCVAGTLLSVIVIGWQKCHLQTHSITQ